MITGFKKTRPACDVLSFRNSKWPSGLLVSPLSICLRVRENISKILANTSKLECRSTSTGPAPVSIPKPEAIFPRACVCVFFLSPRMSFPSSTSNPDDKNNAFILPQNESTKLMILQSKISRQFHRRCSTLKTETIKFAHSSTSHKFNVIKKTYKIIKHNRRYGNKISKWLK